MISLTSAFPVFVVSNLNASTTFYPAHFDFSIAFENEWYLANTFFHIFRLEAI
jgi:hypothetical protein